MKEYRRLSEEEQRIIDDVKKRTITDYEQIGEFIPVDSFISIIEDLMCEIERLEERYEDSENDKESNYRHLTPAELIDWSDRW